MIAAPKMKTIGQSKTTIRIKQFWLKKIDILYEGQKKEDEPKMKMSSKLRINPKKKDILKQVDNLKNEDDLKMKMT